MIWSKGDDQGGRGYHHGNLKDALIRAALDLIVKKGPAGLSIAQELTWTRLSPDAPYRHLRARVGLLASVALRGFEALDRETLEASIERGPDPLVDFEAVG